jgi:hypothetical protein
MEDVRAWGAFICLFRWRGAAVSVFGSNRIGILVSTISANVNMRRGVPALIDSTPSLGFLANLRQHTHARPKVRNWNIIEQFMSKLECFCTDLRNDALRPPGEVHGLATAIVGGVFARHPTVIFKPMQQRHKSRLFDSQAGRNLRLGQRARSNRQMQQCPPLRLAQSHRFEPLVQF